MSVDVCVRVRREVSVADLKAAAASTMEALFRDEVMAWGVAEPEGSALAANKFCLSVSACAGEAEVQLLTFWAGPIDDPDDEGGWWLDVGVVRRNPPSKRLMFLVAASVARLLEEVVYDDSGLLGEGRLVEPSRVLEVIGAASSLGAVEPE